MKKLALAALVGTLMMGSAMTGSAYAAHVGVAMAQFDDNFLTVLRNGIDAYAKTLPDTTGRHAMGILRRHHDELGTRYQMREKLVSIGDDFWIENADGERVFKVDGKAMRVRDTLVVKSPSGEELFTVRERKLSIRDKMTVERDGDTVATVHKALVSPLRQRFKVELEDGGELEAHGNIVDHEYEIERDGHKVAEVSKRWLRVRDTYGIEIAPSENQALVLALTICIDQMAHD